MGLAVQEDSILTVYCLSYNHAEYIRAALDGFVSQECEYPFCVIVHDDASTDSSQQIITEYAERYPGCIIPVFQTENQYSRGINIMNEFIFPRISSEYTAVCEGDDCWCDSSKLQRQLDWMTSHPEYSMCVHETEIIDRDGTGTGEFISSGQVDCDIDAGRIIRDFGGNLFHTSSFLFRTEIRRAIPDGLSIKRASDYSQAIWMALNGKIRYIARCMSKYRVNVEGSWSAGIAADAGMRRRHTEDTLEYLDRLDSYTEGRWTGDIEDRRTSYRFNLLMAEGNINAIKADPVLRKRYFKTVELVNLKRKIKKMIFPANGQK